ncbi:WD40 repeat-like protein [Hyaloscypha variabilis F]|uniref:WD40 repeat-like protein n=1 Tax=Hyaloscypha variabilis (strain UAMH 11265 / GT02V1 / F) TaxID=1149755 RepID=A0A2J6RSJ9_HYAVF|nr:WD40 repeat-like protein [Hyaloscypha variabilis F]
MDPPARPNLKRRPAVIQSGSSGSAQNFTPDGSPSPFASNAKSMQAETEMQPRSRNQTVSIEWIEGDDPSPRRTSRLQIELAECVETKTVTTTTTTKRSYPPLLIREQLLDKLDTKEYPLALKAIPAGVNNFSYDINDDLEFEDYEQVPLTEDTHLHSRTQVFNRRNASSGRMASPSRKVYKMSLEEKADFQRAESVSKRLSAINHRRSVRGAPEAWPGSPQTTDSILRKSKKHFPQKIKDEDYELQKDLVRQKDSLRRRNLGLGMHMAEDLTFPATPDMSEHDSVTTGQTRPSSSFFESTYTPRSGLSQNDSFEDVPSPQETSNTESFANAVATPPIAESDLEPFEEANSTFAQISGQRPSINTAAAQNASLPSPGLSPTFASAELRQGEFARAMEEDELVAGSPATQSGDSQETIDIEDIEQLDSQALRAFQTEAGQSRAGVPSVVDTRFMIETFAAMPNDMKTFMMCHFLKRCSRKTLHVIADVVNPALKCDFLDQLPMELSLHILSFLNHVDLCRAAQVSKQWRNIVDSNETGWKELFDIDGFVLPAGELEKAIQQGWGWQDPYGPDGFEQDLSVQRGLLSSSDGDVASTKVDVNPSRKGRSAAKRKRAPGGLGSDRSKRRATGHEFADKAQGMVARYPHTARFHKSEGPLSAANAAAIAVPDPELGLPGLRKLHLFKSLYRRHHMLQHSWMSGKVAPHHFAFQAHPAHVITCLQFDDDKILTGSDDTLIHVYDTKTGVLRKKLEGHEGGVWALQYEGNVLVSGSTDRSVRVWDIEKGLCTQVFHGHTSTVRCLQILVPEMTGLTEKGKPIMVPEKPLIITGSRDSQLRVWRLPEQGSKRYIPAGPPANDADCPYFVRVLTGHLHSVRAIAAHQDTLVSGSYDNTVRVWKISTGETVWRLQGHAAKVYSVVLDHKRNRCISGSMDNFVKIWSLETGACLFTLEGHTSLVGLLDLRDERLVSAAADSTLRIWDPETGQCKSTLSAHTGAITCFQHDGQKVISGSDRTLKLWNIKTGECTKDLLTDLSGVWQVKFDERRCVAAVQRNNLTYVEVLDFGASRDGIPATQRGTRNLLRFDEDRIIVEEEEDR